MDLLSQGTAAAPPAPGLVGVRAYAKHAGISPGTVSKQLRKGIIPNRGTAGAPQIDPREADRARAEQLNPLKARQRGGELGYERSLEETDAILSAPAGERRSPSDDAEDEPPPAPARPGLAQAALAEKAVRAQLLQLQLERERSVVCDVAGVESAAAAAISKLHDQLRQRNRELGERLARMSDPAAIEAALAESDRLMLERWQSELRNALGQDDERQAA